MGERKDRVEPADFCRTEYPKLVGVLAFYCGDADVAQELAQDTLARVWRHWGRVSKLEDPSAWARRVAINLAKSRFRRIQAERRAKQRMPFSDSTYVNPDIAEAQEIRKAIARLPNRQKTALILHYYLDLPFREVAEIMQAPEPTVRSLTRRGLAALRRSPQLVDPKEVTDVG